jgi:hypothetical protein
MHGQMMIEQRMYEEALAEFAEALQLSKASIHVFLRRFVSVHRCLR